MCFTLVGLLLPTPVPIRPHGLWPGSFRRDRSTTRPRLCRSSNVQILGSSLCDPRTGRSVIEMEGSKAEFLGGAPCPVSPPGLLTEFGARALREPHENVHFVGTETSTEWKGYMKRTIRSGGRDANEVIRDLQQSSLNG
ncbi:uncharacterized protein ACLA_097000 [Aspergillus clavatus NRRL 1]|uniref:monoamine oxidase n=1 Tax=Aspergillus clavatus (strain ATCC 1007 / CBS 513.65 / DSM 816 / NCTC 3887 / NRRL 1 / QM 1276 / 107) TaxID=344612 RepID=A1CMH8_ASPCL|nr:uncharacterized protein ACLA_097000 [Aspergillus clavatus NRRL 1]EAW08765.1 hypothetical protein ACLA_097000 [Aspergillus clavatus NRRL 1]